MTNMIDIRRIFTHVESIAHEFGPPPAQPLLRGAIGVVMTNPYAGRYEADILPMMDALGAVGLDMAERLRIAMDVRRRASISSIMRVSSSLPDCRLVASSLS